MEGSPRPIGGHDKARRISGVTAPPGWLHRVCFEEGLEAHFLFDMATRGVVDANKSAEQLSGYSREELLELRPADLHPRGAPEPSCRPCAVTSARNGSSSRRCSSRN